MYTYVFAILWDTTYLLNVIGEGIFNFPHFLSIRNDLNHLKHKPDLTSAVIVSEPV